MRLEQTGASFNGDAAPLLPGATVKHVFCVCVCVILICLDCGTLICCILLFLELFLLFLLACKLNYQ